MQRCEALKGYSADERWRLPRPVPAWERSSICVSAANESEPLPGRLSYLRVCASSAEPPRAFRCERAAAAVSAVLGRGRCRLTRPQGLRWVVGADGVMRRGLLSGCWSLAYE